jgi:hypothetical protein
MTSRCSDAGNGEVGEGTGGRGSIANCETYQLREEQRIMVVLRGKYAISAL